MYNLFVCSIPCYLGECLSSIEEWHMVPGENFGKLCTNITYEKSGVVFQEIMLNLFLQMQNQATSALQSSDDFYDLFADIVSDHFKK